MPCGTCRGAGVSSWFHEAWHLWRKPLDRLHLLEERLERTVRATVDGLLLAFGVIGAVLGAMNAMSIFSLTGLSRGLAAVPEMLREFWEFQGNGMLVFWLSVLTDLYVFYRFEQTRLVRAPIPAALPTSVETPAGSFPGLLHERLVEVSDSYLRPTMMIVEQAFAYASRRHHATLEPEHLLAVIGHNPDAALVLLRLGVTGQPVQERLRTVLGRIAVGAGEPTLSGATRAVLIRAYELAQAAKLLQVTPPHLLEALAKEPSPAQEILFDLNADEERVHNVVLWALMQRRLFHAWSKLRLRALNKPKSGMDRAMTAQATPVLDHFSTDLTQQARRGHLPLVVNRERELDDTFRVVESGRHNVILVGDKGVGTTSVLQAVAERMAAEEVPEVLKDKRLVQLSIPALISGAGGDLERRLQEIIVEIVKAGNIVLAVEDIHELVGVSSLSGQAFDLASILGKVLENRAFVAFATTTPDGYRRYVEPSALFTAFEKVEVREMTSAVAIHVLESKASPVEARHEVFFSYGAIEQIVKLSVRYIHDRYLPEKALTLLEEVASFTKAAKGRRAIVTAEDAAAVVSRRMNINVASVTQSEAVKLLNLEDRMHERMVGQDQAIAAVANALRRSRAELRDPKRPVAIFLFLGPTGVGKTELAKTVAEVYFGNEENMIRLDMSEYQDPASLSRLLGVAPGYAPAGGGGGYLTEAARTNPFSLILLDELEKAHPDILNVFLQVFDDGRLTDAAGRTIDFTNTIIIATSNAGTDVIQQRMKEGQAIEEIREELMERELGRYFRPEFLNRFDDIIVFKPLSPEEIESITARLLKKIAGQLEERGISLRASPAAVKELAAAGFDPVFGARPLRRVLQERVDNALATFLLTGKLSRRDVAVLEGGGVIRVEHGPML